jgi:methionyl-tRNA formyltransferase
MKVIFAGTPEFALPILQGLIDSQHEVCAVLTQPDRPKGRGRKLAFSAVKQMALANELPLYQPSSLKGEEIQSQLAEMKADVMVVVAYGLILPKAVLALPKFGCLNVHASILPKYRGASPIQSAILQGDLQSGVTIMQMDVGLDTGDMCLVETCPIDASDTSQSLHDKLSELGADALLQVLQQLTDQTATFIPQDNNQATYAAKIQKSDAQINWQLSANTLCQQIRAYNPWPISYCSLADGKIMRIWQATVVELPSHLAASPGEIIEISKERLVIACGEQGLSIEKLQLPGSKPMSIKDCLNAKRDLFTENRQLPVD